MFKTFLHELCSYLDLKFINTFKLINIVCLKTLYTLNTREINFKERSFNHSFIFLDIDNSGGSNIGRSLQNPGGIDLY